VANVRGQFAEQAHAEEQALLHARRAGRPWHPAGFELPLVVGSVPAAEALERLDRLATDPPPRTLAFRALLLGMLDRVDEAQSLALQADERLRERTGREASFWPLAEVAVLAGDLDAAAWHLRTYCEWLEEDENYAFLSTFAPSLGRVLCALGRYDDAEPLARRGRELGSDEDASTQSLWRQVQALVCSARGQHAEAERLAREAVEITERTDGLQWQGDALCDLAEVLGAAGRRDDAVGALREAVDRYERKQIIPLAARARERIAVMQATPTSRT
jgi:ATP/maltotriose-dependent transcriptional regulator MalT